MHDTKSTIGDFLNAAASKQPTPGGGSVAALVGALAASMGEMTINYSLGHKDLQVFVAELKPALESIHRAREVLEQLMADDQAAFDMLSKARKLAPDVPDRDAKIAAATMSCIRVPQTIAATSLAVLELTDKIVNFVNPRLLSDLAVCADLAMASTRCGIYNVRINLKEVSDPAERRKIESTTSQILTRAAGIIQRAAPRIWERVSLGA